MRGAKRLFTLAVLLAGLAGCAGRPEGLMRPVTAAADVGREVTLFVATTRRTAEDEAILFTGERSRTLAFARIGVSIPPTHKPGEIEWPQRFPGDPATSFVTTGVARLDRDGFRTALRDRLRGSGHGRVLVFVHGYNNRFDDAVYRFAQIVHDSGAPVVPILFTWPSRGRLLAYGYDRESATYSRDQLETLLTALAEAPNVREVAILAHSMGNWVTLEALRQMAIRKGAIPAKIDNVMLAAPDVDVDVARTQIVGMGPRRPHFTLFTSRDDRALQVSKAVWGSSDRLGSIDPDDDRYRRAIAEFGVDVYDLTALQGGDRLNHGKFAAAPEVVRFIGTRLAAGQEIGTGRVGLGDHLGAAIAGTAATVGNAAGVVVSAPLAIVDPTTRENLSDRIEQIAAPLPRP